MTAGALTIADQSLVVFVDDTGHEALVPCHPVYGLGGCAAMAGDLDRLIRHPWHEVRRKVAGSADPCLDASRATASRGEGISWSIGQKRGLGL